MRTYLNKYKIIQDYEGVIEQGFYILVDTKENKIINLFQFKKEAKDYLKLIKNQ